MHALLDFLYFTQYPIHINKTLDLMDTALEHFHENKAIFCDLGIHDSFNILKLHWACHYASMIQLYGTTNNVNTQYTEHLHIDLTKDAYAATNRKDKFSQMASWLEQKEKILRHVQHVKWHLAQNPALPEVVWQPPGLKLDHAFQMSKYPSVSSMSFDELSTRYGAPLFRTALA
jgi:hypothetical protein